MKVGQAGPVSYYTGNTTYPDILFSEHVVGEVKTTDHPSHMNQNVENVFTPNQKLLFPLLSQGGKLNKVAEPEFSWGLPPFLGWKISPVRILFFRILITWTDVSFKVEMGANG